MNRQPTEISTGLIGFFRMHQLIRNAKTLQMPYLYCGGQPFLHTSLAILHQYSPANILAGNGRLQYTPDSGPMTIDPWEYHGDERQILQCCSCGQPECSSTLGRVTAGTLNNIRGFWIHDMIADMSEDKPLYMPPIFIPENCWPRKHRYSRYYHMPMSREFSTSNRHRLMADPGRVNTESLYSNNAVAAAEWDRLETALPELRQAAEGLMDPWGRKRNFKRLWKERNLAIARTNPSQLEIQRQYLEITIHEVEARLRHNISLIIPLLQTPANLQQERLDNYKKLEHSRRQLAELDLPSRQRRLLRRARRRSQKESSPDSYLSLAKLLIAFGIETRSEDEVADDLRKASETRPRRRPTGHRRKR